MSKLGMPIVDRKLLAKKQDVVSSLKKIIKAENVLDHEDQTRVFETDALTAYRQKPLVAVFPENTQEVSKILSYYNIFPDNIPSQIKSIIYISIIQSIYCSIIEHVILMTLSVKLNILCYSSCSSRIVNSDIC